MRTIKSVVIMVVALTILSCSAFCDSTSIALVQAMKVEGLSDEQINRIIQTALKLQAEMAKTQSEVKIADGRVVTPAEQMTTGQKQALGRRIINDARQLDAAIDQWALEKGKKDGDTVNTSEAATYLGGKWTEIDLLGNPHQINRVGRQQVKIADRTKAALAGVGIDWGQF